MEVTADSLYEAAVLGLKALKSSAWVDAVGPATRLNIQIVEPAAEHMILVAQLTRLLDGGATSPANVMKEEAAEGVLAT